MSTAYELSEALALLVSEAYDAGASHADVFGALEEVREAARLKYRLHAIQRERDEAAREIEDWS